MKHYAIGVLSFAAAASFLNAEPPPLRASFPNGTTIEVYTETTGSTPIQTNGIVGIGPGPGMTDLVNRVVVGRANNEILFAYNLEAEPAGKPDTVSIRIRPISAETEAGFLKNSGRDGLPRVLGDHLPTVSGVRNFPAVKIGDAVKIDILYNPSTGEKIYDVLRPIPGAATSSMSTYAPGRQAILFKEITIRVNNESFTSSGQLLTGAAVRIVVPGHGAYVLAASDTRSAVPNRAVAHVDGRIVTWQIDGDNISLLSNSMVLSGSERGTLWVYHDAQFRSRDQPDQLYLQATDKVESLYPRKD